MELKRISLARQKEAEEKKFTPGKKKLKDIAIKKNLTEPRKSNNKKVINATTVMATPRGTKKSFNLFEGTRTSYLNESPKNIQKPKNTPRKSLADLKKGAIN